MTCEYLRYIFRGVTQLYLANSVVATQMMFYFHPEFFCCFMIQIDEFRAYFFRMGWWPQPPTSLDFVDLVICFLILPRDSSPSFTTIWVRISLGHCFLSASSRVAAIQAGKLTSIIANHGKNSAHFLGWYLSNQNWVVVSNMFLYSPLFGEDSHFG